MELADNEKSKKLLKLLERKLRIEERKLKIEEQIRIEEDKIRLKLGKMTSTKKKQYQKMKQAYLMRQEGSTFLEIGNRLDLSASQVSLLCQRYAVLMELLEKKK
ncbi:hypothetical protein KKI24_04515 [bacterium]|nr:hypothetical protein [bacterium]